LARETAGATPAPSAERRVAGLNALGDTLQPPPPLTASQAPLALPNSNLAVTQVDTPDPVLVNRALTYTLLITNFGPNAVNGGVLPLLTLTNTATITMPANQPAELYPSIITVSGVTGTLSAISVTLLGFTHGRTIDVDVLLESPSGRAVMLMSDVGAFNPANNITVTIGDGAVASMPTGSALSSGAYRPTNFNDGGSDLFFAPAPAAPYGTALDFLSNTEPNGDWKLYVMGDSFPATGTLNSGWKLDLMTVTPLTVTVSNTLPSNYVLNGATGTGWACGAVMPVVTCTRPFLNVNTGSPSAIVITGTAPGAPGVITATARITAAVSDSNLANNISSASTTVNAVVTDLSITGRDSADPTPLNQFFTYYMTATNAPTTTTDVNMVMTLPPAAAFLTASSGCSHVSGVVTCTIGILTGTTSVMRQVNVMALVEGTFSATMRVNTPDIDFNLANNIYTETTTIISARIAITPAEAPLAQAANLLTLVPITITNNGLTPLNWSTGEAPDLTSPCASEAVAWLGVTQFSGTNNGGESYTNTLTVNSAGLAPAQYVGVICFVSNDPTRPELRLPVTLTVLPTFNFVVTPVNQLMYVDPNMVITHTFAISHLGDYTDTFLLNMQTDHVFSTSVPSATPPVGVGGAVTVNVVVTIPIGAASQLSSTTQVQIVSQGNPALSTTVTAKTIVRHLPQVAIDPLYAEQIVGPNAVVTYHLWVTNTSNDFDTFSITLIISGSVFAPQINTSTAALAVGEAAPLWVTMTVPPTALDGEVSQVRVRATSLDDNVTSATATLITRVYWNRIYLPFIRR
jgi:subtilisin-like proprotein convertase family protein